MEEREAFEEEISLREIFDILRNRAKYIVAVMLFAILTSSVYTFFIKDPVYEAYTTLMVVRPAQKIQDPTSQITYQEIQTNRLLVSTYGEIAKSRSVLDEVIKNLNLDATFESLRSHIEVNLVKNTEIIEIRVRHTDPEMAAAIANETARCFSKQIVRIMNAENVEVIDEAIPIYRKIEPKPALNISLSLILGLMVGVFLAFILEFMDTSIKDNEDVVKYLGLPVIGTIPYVEKGDAA